MNQKLILIFLTLVLLYSCKKDEDDAETITGSELQMYRIHGSSSYQLQGVNTEEDTIKTISDTIHMTGTWASNGITNSIRGQEYYILLKDTNSVNYLLTMNAKTGIEIGRKALSPNERYIGLEFGEFNKQLYALRISDLKHLVKINPENGDVEQVSTSPIDFDYTPTDDNTEILQDKKIYILLAAVDNDLHLISIDLETGEQLNTFIMAQQVQRIQYKPATNLLYCLLRENVVNFSFASVDYTNGEFALIRQDLFIGQPYRVDYNPNTEEYALIYNDANTNIITYNITEDKIKTVLNIETAGFMSLDYIYESTAIIY